VTAALLVWMALLGAAVGLARAEGPDGVVAPGASAKILDIEAKILDIVGASSALEGALAELGAKVTEEEIQIALAADVVFDFDKADLRPEAETALIKLAQILQAYPKAPVRIEGHTDSKGSDSYNQKLSERRALAVKEWLVRKAGVAAARLTTRGLGETSPVAPNTRPDGNDDPAGRQRNRRVEIILRKR
jgi:outer membrane protein OmpA-like peptidoglycan-associated protein